MNQPNPADQVKPVLSFALWVFVVSLAFLYVFISFRGLNSPAAIDQAQIARELAQGHGFSTQMIRPASLQQMQANGKDVSFVQVPDTYNPPLQPLIWAPVFKALQSWWAFDRTSTVYLLDRVIACMGAIWLLLTLLLLHGMTRRLFDRTLANFAVLALALSRPLWDMVTTGGSRALLLFLVTASAWCLVLLIRRSVAGERAGFMPLLLALTCTAMVMTNWMTVWIVLGLAIAIGILLPGHRLTMILCVLLPALAIAGWLARNKMVCGDPLGATKATLQSVLMTMPDSVQLRDFDSSPPPVMLAALTRKLNANLSGQLQNMFDHMLGVVPAVLFFLSLLHRFRREEVNKMRLMIAIVWLCAIIGMAMLGLPGKSEDDNQLHAMLVPVMTMFGLAALAVFWARMNPGSGGLWTRHGFAILAIALGGWPMIMGLTSDLRIGLFLKNTLMQPDYRAASISRLQEMVANDELIVSDAPWAVAWYADRPCLWMPKTRQQFTRLREQAERQSHHVAGFLTTTLCIKDNNLASQFSGPYGDWTDLISRGPMASLGFDLASSVPWLREYPKMLPMGGLQMTDGKLVFTSNFFADRDRWAGMNEERKAPKKK